MAFSAMENGGVSSPQATTQQPQACGSRLPRKQRAHEDEEQGKLFVGGLSWDTTQDTLLRYFGRFGEVIDCVVMKNAESGRSGGFGFVTFSDPGNIEAVLSSCPHTLDGRTIDPKACNPRSMQKPKKTNFFPKVFLGGLPSNITETDLRNFFSRYGEVCEIIIMYDQEKKKSRGFGFLSFSDDQAVNRACAEHFVNIQNKQVEIKRAEPRAQAAVSWSKDVVEQWGGGGPPPLAPMQTTTHQVSSAPSSNPPHQQHVTSNGGHAHAAYAWGSSAGSTYAPAAPAPTPTQYGSTQLVPWGPPPPAAAPTPPPAQWGSFASPPPGQFPTAVYHPPPSVTPQPSYWSTAAPGNPPPTAAPTTYSAYGSYGSPYPPPVKQGGAAAPAYHPHHHHHPAEQHFYHHTNHAAGLPLGPPQPPVAISPPGPYNSSDLAASALGPQRGGTTLYSTQQPSQYHPYRRS